MSEELKELLVYPKNPQLKKAYIALLGVIQQKKAIRYTVFDAGVAICDYMGWVLDYDPRRMNMSPGPKYKQCLRLLKNLEGSFIFFPNMTANVIEVCVYEAVDRTRVVNFSHLFTLFENDLYASEFGGVIDDLVITPWEDQYKEYHELTDDETHQIQKTVDNLNKSIQLTTGHDVIESSFEGEYDLNPSTVLTKYINDLKSGNNSASIEG